MKATVTQLFLLFTLNAIAQKLPQSSDDANVYRELARVSKPKHSSDDFTRQNNNKEYVEIFTKYANENNVHALNMLALTYQNGRKGVDVNKSKAVELFSKAGKLGYSNSWFHLGQMFRACTRNEQDYDKALEYYKKGSALNNNLCTYYAGYMLYKGLGSKQGYKEAVAYFTKGSLQNEMECMYFLGLCYKNGHGVLQNIDSAKKWLNKAAQMRHFLAQNELFNINTEETKKPIISFYEYKKIINNYNSTDDLYKGVLLTFDWSGKYIINQQKIQIQLKNDNNNLSGYLQFENEQAKYKFSKNVQKNELVFDTTSNNNFISKSNFEKARLENISLKFNNQNGIEGNMTSYSIYQNHETLNPQYIVAYSTAPKNNFANNIKQKQIIYPNPFANNFVISLNVGKSTDLYATLTDINGSVIYHKKITVAQAGLLSIPVAVPMLAKGIYFLTIQYPHYLQTTKIIKQ